MVTLSSHQEQDSATDSVQSYCNFEVPQVLIEWLYRYTDRITEEWSERLSGLSPSYNKRPRSELDATVGEAFAANLELLGQRRFNRIDRFINFITELRLGAGFPLSDVQRSFELFRTIVLRRLIAADDPELLSCSIEPVNACLAYTIHRFSNHFQRMHELTLRKYAGNLEREIGLRTAELAESERRYKTLVEEINDGYFVVQNQRIIFANQAFCRMHRTTLEEVIGHQFLNFVTPDCRTELFKAYKGVLDGTRGAGQVQYTRTGMPKERAFTEVRARAVDLGDGPVLIGICRDISERVQMEAKIREHERLAYVGHLSASLSHEINNPLSSIKMNLQILARKLDISGYDRRRLEITVHGVSRLEGILRQLLDIARPVTVNAAPLDLSALAKACVDLLEIKAHEKGITIVEKYPKNLPHAELDAGKLEQAVINLLINAIEATPEGGRVTIWTKAIRQPVLRVEIGVRDTGAGIDKSRMPLIFTPFCTSKSHGSGLGLSNVKRVVDAHSGEIKVLSSKGRGASFILRLPCRR